jgi:CRP-like cAMP-binding protein
MSGPLRALLDSPDFPEGQSWRRRRVEAGEVVLREGDLTPDVYVILAGSVRVTGTVEVEAQRVLHPAFCDLEAGEIFGELCLFDDQPRSASVTALTACEVAVVPGQGLMAFLDAHPERGYPIMKFVIHTLVDRLRTANRRFVSVFAWGLRAYRIDQHL